MADFIQLLPDSIANQIAAGEVIQRPASVVKELLENAIDAGSTEIKLIVKDAGKALIQVIDNGCGMSASDLPLALARHATSKIDGSDLLDIRSFGFRGEALASIAEVSHMKIRSRTSQNDSGFELLVHGGNADPAMPCGCANGNKTRCENAKLLFFQFSVKTNKETEA